jgi:hypothetical protein
MGPRQSGSGLAEKERGLAESPTGLPALAADLADA